MFFFSLKISPKIQSINMVEGKNIGTLNLNQSHQFHFLHVIYAQLMNISIYYSLYWSYIFMNEVVEQHIYILIS